MATHQTVTAAARGSRRGLLVSIRTRLASAVESPHTAARDLAPLTRLLLEIAKEIEAMDKASAGDGIGHAAGTPDGGWSGHE